MKKPTSPSRTGQTFLLLLLIRWLSLGPPLVAVLLRGPDGATAAVTQALVLAVILNGGLTLFTRRITPLIRRIPGLMLLDLVFSGMLVWRTGGEYSPFYFYSLTPILGAAYFFQMRGGLSMAAIYAALYGLIVFGFPQRHPLPHDLVLIISQLISFFIIALMVGYISVLLEDLRGTHHDLSQSHVELTRRNRDLNLIQELTLLLQSSVDPAELQEQILRGLVHEMGYRRATIGLYMEEQNALTGWMTLEELPMKIEPKRLGHATTISLDGDAGPISRAICAGKPVEISDGEVVIRDAALARRLVTGKHYLVLPLVLRQNPLGVLIVDQLSVQHPLPEAERQSLERLAAHAGVALGSVRMCINRAQQQAVLAERNRIAAELHDSISQVLYGLAYGLDACVQLLPEHPQQVREELAKLQPVVADAQARMRKAIFAMHAAEITSDAFSARLHRHLNAICPARDLALRIELPGEFDRWDASTRQLLYQVAQEAMTNAARHADAQRIVITVSAEKETFRVQVEDDGRGFEPDRVKLSDHLGIQSMAERVKRAGGDLEIHSQIDRGTIVLASIPSEKYRSLRFHAMSFDAES